MKNKFKIIVIAQIILSIGLLVSAGPVQAGIVENAYVEGSGGVNVQIYPDYMAGKIVNVSLSHPGSKMVSLGGTVPTKWENGVYSDFIPTQAVASISLAGGKKPRIDVRASATNGISADAKGTIIYYFISQKIFDDAPDYVLPIWIYGAGEILANWSEGTAGCGASVYYKGPSPNFEVTILVDKHSSEVPKGQKNPFKYWSKQFLETGKVATLSLTVSGGSRYSQEQRASGSIQGWIDPTVEIDPTHMVEYKGEMVPATSLYRLVFSPGFQPNISPFLGLLLGE